MDGDQPGAGRRGWILEKRWSIAGHVLFTTWFFMRGALWMSSRGRWEYCGMECFPELDFMLLLAFPIVLVVWLLVAAVLSLLTEDRVPSFVLADLLTLPVLFVISLALNDSIG